MDISQRKIIINAGAVILKDNKFALVLEKNPPFAGRWNFPLGRVETNEKIIDTAVREAFEETGLNIQLNGFLGIYQTLSQEGYNVVIVMFTAEVVSGTLHHDHNEHAQVKWFSIDELNKLADNELFHPEMKNVVKKAQSNTLSLDSYKEF